jgi:hypothetical protein
MTELLLFAPAIFNRAHGMKKVKTRLEYQEEYVEVRPGT